ncbi:MAG TPA: thiamine phosphate synthase [Candidatus Dormibacteraeota bacterium]|nr:thiamine phosphate synthase [Candidatus Dormibacteraeota bacterium]
MGVADERQKRLARMRLYVITGDRGGEVETARIVEAALEGGANVIQLRKKTMEKGELYALALALRRLTLLHDALFIVNDHVDIAIAADADGVHLGQADLAPAVVRGLPGFRGRLIGRSTHSVEQAGAAMVEGADYIAVGPVFPTPTKAGRPAVGIGLVTEVAAIADRPFVAVGGIDHDNAPAVVEAGARAIAVVRAVYDAEDPAEATRRLREITSTRLEVARR